MAREMHHSLLYISAGLRPTSYISTISSSSFFLQSESAPRRALTQALLNSAMAAGAYIRTHAFLLDTEQRNTTDGLLIIPL